MPQRPPLFVKTLFAIDLSLALLPPIHWTAGSGAWIFGVPTILVYFFGAGIFVSASVVVAYLSDPIRLTAER